MERRIHNILLLIFSATMVACSSDDYVSVIPENSTALLSVDVPKLAESKKGVDARLIRVMFHVTSPDDCGIDMSQKLYVFENPDGTFGFVAGVKDEQQVGNWLTKMQQQGFCGRRLKQQEKQFAIINNLWVAAYDDHAFLVVGPVLPTAQPTMMRRMAKMLNGNSNIRETALFGKLESMTEPMVLVAQAHALPDQLVALCTLGAPADTPADKVLLSATITDNDCCLLFEGAPFSFDETIDAALKKAAQAYRPMNNKFIDLIPQDAIYTILANVNGKGFLPLLQDNKQLNAMLSGMSTKVDIDAFMGNVDGDMAFSFSGAEDNLRMRWAAEQSDDAQPLDQDSQRWLDNNSLLVGGDVVSSIPAKVKENIKDKRMATIINLAALKAEDTSDGDIEDNSIGLNLSLMPLGMFSDAQYLVFTLSDNIHE